MLTKSKSNSIEVVISKALIDYCAKTIWYIVLKQYNEMKEEIKRLKT